MHKPFYFAVPSSPTCLAYIPFTHEALAEPEKETNPPRMRDSRRQNRVAAGGVCGAF